MGGRLSFVFDPHGENLHAPDLPVLADGSEFVLGGGFLARDAARDA